MHCPRPFPWITLLTVLLVIEAFALTAFQAPFLTFNRFATLDSGGELAIQDLLRRGYRPAVDFGYPYGLLSLLVSRAWYGLLGLSPWTYLAEVMVCTTFSVWGLARFAAYRRVGPAGLALIALAIPDLLSVTYVTFVQTLEQALLINALAEQARGRRATALTLLTACCFVKPSLAFVQGLAVTIAIVAACRRSDRAAWVRALSPSLITATALAAVLAASFGAVPLARTFIPRTGMAIYRMSHYGFFHGVGREFWDLPNAGLRDYFRYEVGFWLLGTAFLTCGGLLALWRLARGLTSGDRAIADEVVATCAVVHLGFVALLFGHRGTWVYSLPMLILGLATLAPRGPWYKTAIWVLALMLLVSDRSKTVEVVRRWKTDSPSATTLGLWTSQWEREEWARVLELTRGQHPVLFTTCEGGALLLPDFAPPEGGYLIPGNMLPIEARRKAKQLAAASIIVTDHPPDWPGYALWPELKAALDGCEIVMEGRMLRVYRRGVTTGARGQAPSAVTPGRKRRSIAWGWIPACGHEVAPRGEKGRTRCVPLVARGASPYCCHGDPSRVPFDRSGGESHYPRTESPGEHSGHLDVFHLTVAHQLASARKIGDDD